MGVIKKKNGVIFKNQKLHNKFEGQIDELGFYVSIEKMNS